MNKSGKRRLAALGGFGLTLGVVAGVGPAGPSATASHAATECAAIHSTVGAKGQGDPSEQELNQAAHDLTDLAQKLGEGFAYDFTDDDRYTMVLDPSVKGREAETAREINNLDLPVSVEIVDVCVALGDLDALKLQIDKTYEAEGIGDIGIQISPALAQVTAEVSDSEFADTLRQTFGDRISVVISQMSLTSRETDNFPHYGGSRIWVASCDDGQTTIAECGWCSSGFKMISDGGNPFITTAGHCTAHNWNWRSGTPGGTSYLVGTAQSLAHFPTTDIVRLDSPGLTYANKIYASPEQYSRTVTGSQNPVEGEYVCNGGTTSEQTCGIKVREVNTDRIIDGYHFYHLARAHYNDTSTNTVAQGDSGGPVFSREANGTATIQGSVTAATSVPSSDCETISKYGRNGIITCPQLLFTQVVAVEGALDAQVATS